jgi:uncharacterized membrane protein
MLYTHLGRIVAVLGLLFGIFAIYHSWSRMWGIQPVGLNDVERIERLSHQIETGILIVLFAIAVGILTEISRSIRAPTNTPVGGEPDHPRASKRS